MATQTQNTSNHTEEDDFRTDRSTGSISPHREINGVWQTYDARDGLPDSVGCLLQDRKGYLLVGTWIGLYRYDGGSFHLFYADPDVTDNSVSAICEDSTGRLWFNAGGMAGDSRGVVCYDGQRFILYSTADGLAGDMVTVICEDRKGRIWFGTNNGASCFDGERFFTYREAEGLADHDIVRIHADRQGRVWFYSVEKGVIYLSPSTDLFRAQSRDSESGDDSQVTQTRETFVATDNREFPLFEDHKGRTWFNIDSGVACYDGDNRKVYTFVEGTSVRAVCEDREGHLWFGTNGYGVSCFDGERMIHLTGRYRLLGHRPYGMIRDREGSLWGADPFSGLIRLEPDTLQWLTTESIDFLYFQDFLCFQDQDDHLWYRTTDRLYRLPVVEKTGFDRDMPAATDSCRIEGGYYCVLKDRHGGIWVAGSVDSPGRLYRYPSVSTGSGHHRCEAYKYRLPRS